MNDVKVLIGLDDLIGLKAAAGSAKAASAIIKEADDIRYRIAQKIGGHPGDHTVGQWVDKILERIEATP